MDLPICPACGQSVLDDDVEDCPFCGASLSGKPNPAARKAAAGAATASPAAAGSAARAGTKDPVQRGSQSAPAAADAAAAKSGGAKGGAASAKARDDDFDDPDQAARNAAAIPVRTKPLKGPSIEVVCPMCETAGFVPQQAAGKDVRCANPQCLVPIFRLAGRATDDDASKPKPKSSKKRIGAVLGVVLMAGGGFALWWFALRTPYVKPIPLLPKSDDGTAKKTPEDPRNGGGKTVVKDPPVEPGPTTVVKGTDPPPAAKISLAALRAEVLAQMTEVAKRSTNNRSKADCRRMTATTFVRLGLLDEARVQLEQLALVGKAVPYSAVEPLTEMAWWQRRRGAADDARRTLAEAVERSASLPANGQSAQEDAARLAGLLAAEGRFAEVPPLVEAHRSEPALERLALDLTRELEYGTCDAAALAQWSPSSTPLRTPQVAAAFWLAVRGDVQAGRTWLAALPAGPVRSAVLVALCEALPLSGVDGSAPGDFRALLGGAEPHASAAALAARALRSARAGRSEDAAKLAADAESALAGIAVPSAAILPDAKTILAWSGPAPDLQFASVAAADLAAFRALQGDATAAGKGTAQALAYLRGTVPAARTVQPLVDENARLGPTGVASRLQSSLKLSAAAARDASTIYRRQCEALRTAALARDEEEAQLLESALRWGLLDLVRQEIDPVGSPAHDATVVPWLLADALRAKGEAAAADAIENALRSRKATAPPRVVLLRKVADQRAQGKLRGVGEAIAKAKEVPRADRARIAAAEATRASDAGRVSEAIDLLEAAGDAVLYERMLEVLAVRNVQRGTAPAFWNLVKSRNLDATELIAACGGLARALPAADPEPDAEKTRAPSGKTDPTKGTSSNGSPQSGTNVGGKSSPGPTATGARVP